MLFGLRALRAGVCRHGMACPMNGLVWPGLSRPSLLEFMAILKPLLALPQAHSVPIIPLRMAVRGIGHSASVLIRRTGCLTRSSSNPHTYICTMHDVQASRPRQAVTGRP